MEQMKAQADQGRRERDRVIQRAETMAESNRRAAQSIKSDFKRIEDIVRADAERKQFEREAERAEREARDAERRYDREMEALERKLEAQQAAVAQLEREEASAPGRVAGGGSFELPPPVQIYEPPSEAQIARGQTAAPAAVDDSLARRQREMDAEHQRNVAELERRERERRVFDSLSSLVEDSAPRNLAATASDTLGRMASDLFDHLPRREDTRREVERLAAGLFDEYAKGGAPSPIRYGLRDWALREWESLTRDLLSRAATGQPAAGRTEWEQAQDAWWTSTWKRFFEPLSAKKAFDQINKTSDLLEKADDLFAPAKPGQ